MEYEIQEMQKLQLLVEKYKLPKIKRVYDLGLGRIEELHELNQYLKPDVIVAFEPNPNNGLAGEVPANSKIIRKAVWDRDGEVLFYAGENSTLLQGSVYEPMENASHISKEDAFTQVNVQTTRLDTFIEKMNMPVPDLLWMDTQGCEYKALVSLGKYLACVSLIHAELWLKDNYGGAPSFDAVDAFLKLNEFVLIAGDPYEGVFNDYTYIRKDLIK